MRVNLTKKEIKNFIETCGDGDVYFSHNETLEGFIEVRYFAKLTHFVDEDSIEAFREELTQNPHLKRKYLSKIILGENFAYFTDKENYAEDPLVQNYPAYVEKLNRQKQEESEKSR